MDQSGLRLAGPWSGLLGFILAGGGRARGWGEQSGPANEPARFQLGLETPAA